MRLILIFTILLLSCEDQSITSLSTESGKVFKVVEDNTLGASISNIYVVTEGFPNSRDTFRFESVDPVEQVFLADLDKNGFEELYITTRSAGSGSYSQIYGLVSNRDLSATPFYLPEISQKEYESGGLFEGYRGHNTFYLENDILINEFPLYKNHDVNSTPTGGKRKVIYQLVKGEASWILKTISN